RRILGVLGQCLGRFLCVHLRVEGEVADEQKDIDEQPVRPESERPFEGHSAQHAEEKRRASPSGVRRQPQLPTMKIGLMRGVALMSPTRKMPPEATKSLTRLRSQIFSVAGMSGSTAMHPSSRTNGMMLHQATTIRGLL